MNPLILTACCVSALLTGLFWLDPDLHLLAIAMLVITAGQVVGSVLIGCGSRRVGAWCVLVASLLNIPLGLIGAFGARQVLDSLQHEAFERGA